MLLAAGVGCGDDPRSLRWRVEFEDASLETRARILEARILEGGCTGIEAWSADVPLTGTQPPAPPALPKGTFGFAITVVSDDCVRYAAGCTEVVLPLEDGAEVVVPIAATAETRICASIICNGGVCEIPDGGLPECPANTGDCNRDPIDGCETMLDTLDHCGACDQPCRLPHATESCVGGVCAADACDDGWADCDGDDATGCEVSIRTVDNCGACGGSCNLPHAAETCETGRCGIVACHPGWADCDRMIGNGCETDLRSPSSCGGCGMTCSDPLSPLCSWSAGTGTCVATCPAGTTMCGMSCVNLTADPDHCGACDSACAFAHGIASCGAAGCQLSACEPLFADCDATTATGCETPLSSTTDCGACGSACTVTDAVTSCVTGDCVIDECFGTFDDCNSDAADGCEADLESALTCGSCEMSCDTRSPICGYAATGQRMCVEACTEPAETLCGDRCEDTDRDLANCGSCGNTCTVANGAPRCEAGSCVVASCDPMRGDCDGLGANGCETDLLSSLQHCGECGALCAGPDAQCTGGVCTVGCPAGMGDCDGDESNGCETVLNTNESCGGCGVACAPRNGVGDCSSGSCEITGCDPGFDDCDGSVGNGCEAAVASDPDNCGGCGISCRPPRCCMGMCC